MLGLSLSITGQQYAGGGNAGTITFTAGTYTRGADGTAPTIANTDIVTSGTTGPYYLDFLTVTNGTTPSQADMDAGSGTGVLEKVTIGPQANIEDLDGSLDLSVTVTNGRIYAQYRDSAGAQSALTSVPTADSITYEADSPDFASAEIGLVDATSLIVTLDRAAWGSTSTADWAVVVNGVGATESAVAFTPGGTTVDITLGAAVTSGQTVTVAYSGTGLVGIDAEQVATFTAQSVTNNVSSASFDAPSNFEQTGSIISSGTPSQTTSSVFAGAGDYLVQVCSLHDNTTSPVFSLSGSAVSAATMLTNTTAVKNGRQGVWQFWVTTSGASNLTITETGGVATSNRRRVIVQKANGLTSTGAIFGNATTTGSTTVSATSASSVPAGHVVSAAFCDRLANNTDATWSGSFASGDEVYDGGASSFTAPFNPASAAVATKTAASTGTFTATVTMTASSIHAVVSLAAFAPV